VVSGFVRLLDNGLRVCFSSLIMWRWIGRVGNFLLTTILIIILVVFLGYGCLMVVGAALGIFATLGVGIIRAITRLF